MPTPSRIILEVERAAEDLRRGATVRLTGVGKAALLIRAGEYFPRRKSVTKRDHPAVQLMKFAGLLPRAVVAPAKKMPADTLTVSADAIRRYPHALVATLTRISEADVPLEGVGKARVIAFRPRLGHEEHLAIVVGNVKSKTAPLVRIHSSCITGDVLGSLRCDCGNQLAKAFALIAQEKTGIVLYLSQEGRGIGIASKLRAYALQDKGLDTVEANEALGYGADERDFALAANMLKQLRVKRVTLITNNPAKIRTLEEHGIGVAKRAALITPRTAHNQRYLDTKAQKLGHYLEGSICDTE